ncbi:MAG: MCE family protein [Bacteroidales bacterium]|nr:MAG: MCE family protein [Bacteroidales bacterium]
MKISKEVKIGIIALVTLVGFFWGLNFLKGINIFKPSDEYYATYDNIEGLIESAVVYLHGYKIGSVRDINFDRKKPGKIAVRFALEEKVKIPKNSVALITTSSMISEIKDINLILSDSSEYYETGDTLIGALDKGMSGIIEPIKYKAEETVANIDSVLIVIKQIFNKSTQANLQHTILNIDSITTSFSSSLSENGSITRSLDNLEQITSSIKSKSTELSSILANLSAFSDSLAKSEIKTTISNTNRTLEETSEILEKINRGEGTFGMLVHNDTLYHNLKNASESLDILLKDLKERPKRYVHFSLFGGKKEPKKSN